MRQYWVAPVGPLNTADSSFSTFTTLQSVSQAPGIILPANLLEVGSEVRIVAMGEFSTTGTPTLQLGLYYGTTATALAANAATTTGSGAASWPWRMEYDGVVRSVGTSGTINGQGVLFFGTSLTAWTVSPIPLTLAARTVTIDTTTAKEIQVGAAWGTSSASNIVKVNDLSVTLIS